MFCEHKFYIVKKLLYGFKIIHKIIEPYIFCLLQYIIYYICIHRESLIHHNLKTILLNLMSMMFFGHHIVKTNSFHRDSIFHVISMKSFS